MRATCVPLPGHVMLRLHAPDRDVVVDPFDHGAVRTHRELLQYLAKNGKTFDATWFGDADEGAMFVRQTLNLRVSYEQRGMQREVKSIERLLEVLSKAQKLPRFG